MGSLFQILMRKLIFLTCFASICTSTINTSTLPSFSCKINSGINYFHVTEKDMLLIIKSLDSTKAQGNDSLSIRMLKICNESITIPLKIIFDGSLKNGVFPEIRKRANAVPIHKKEDKNPVTNCLPISLFPIFGKIYKKVIYNSIFNYFSSNQFLTPFLSSFFSGDSCIAQLLPIIHKIQTLFDENHTVDVGGVFLDICKAFRLEGCSLI